MDKIGVGYADVGEEEERYILDALKGKRLSQGKYVAEFERRFSALHSLKYGVMCNSGTSALHIALEALKERYNWESDAEVLCPAITFIATSNAVLHSGLKVEFVDVDPLTYNINPLEIEKHITAKTRAIIAVHTFGRPCKMAEICKTADKYNLKVIEDCAEAHFAKVGESSVGSFSSIACFSLYVAHTITTGVGGISCTNDEELQRIMRSLVSHGRACVCERCLASDSNKVCPKRFIKDNKESGKDAREEEESVLDRRFTFDRLGYSYRVGELEGALGLAQLKHSSNIMARRRENALLLTTLLLPYSDILQLPLEEVGVTNSYMMYPIVIKNSGEYQGSNGKVYTIKRSDLIRSLEKNNIETRPMLPLLCQPIYKKIFGPDIESKYPVAKYIDNYGFYIGCHHGLGKSEIEYIAQVIIEYINSSIKTISLLNKTTSMNSKDIKEFSMKNTGGGGHFSVVYSITYLPSATKRRKVNARG